MGQQRDADVVVIGAGTGGLTTAAYLAAAGRRVLVVDPGPRPGGHGTVFERGGFSFDIGLHYVGSGRDGRPAPDPMLEPLGIAVDWNRLEPIDTVISPDGSTFAVPTGADAYRQALHRALPGEAAAVDAAVSALETLDAGIGGFTRMRGLADLPAALPGAVPLLRRGRTPLADLFDRLHCSPKARLLLGWIAGTYGMPPSQTPLAVHALATMHYLRGAWYPVGGGSVIADRLAEVVRAHAGEFLLGTRATGIIVERGRAAGVRAVGPDGPVELRAPAVVSGADIKHTFLDLLDPKDVPPAVRRKVRGYEMALPLAVLYAVLDRDLAAEGLPPTNWLVAGDDMEAAMAQARSGRFAAQPPVWITSASLKDPGNPQVCDPGLTSVQLMAPVPPHPSAWGLQLGVERGSAYRGAKQAVRHMLVAAAERAIPGLGAAIVFEDLATPYTFSRYTGVTDGTSYGIALSADQLLLARPGPKTAVDGLYLAGASTRAGHGITGVMAGGTATATAVLGSPAVAAVRSGPGGR